MCVCMIMEVCGCVSVHDYGGVRCVHEYWGMWVCVCA